MTKELIEQSNTVSSFAWALIMETAASFEVASYSISDEDAKKSAEGAIKYARYMANKYYTSPPKQSIPDGWKPIETAPKDGSSFDVWLGNCDESDRNFYCSGDTRRSPNWHYKDGKFRPHITLGSIPTFITPTHWMPLPSAPTNTEVGE